MMKFKGNIYRIVKKGKVDSVISILQVSTLYVKCIKATDPTTCQQFASINSCELGNEEQTPQQQQRLLLFCSCDHYFSASIVIIWIFLTN